MSRIVRCEGGYAESMASVLLAGGVAVLPTDTVYGICQAASEVSHGAIKIFEIKRRQPEKRLPLLIPSIDSLTKFAQDVPSYAKRLVEEYWPGALTIVVKAGKGIEQEYVSPDGSVALRMANESHVAEILSLVGCPLAMTSANTSGMPAQRMFEKLEKRILEEADIALDAGTVAGGMSSTIVDCQGKEPRVLRQGPVYL